MSPARTTRTPSLRDVIIRDEFWNSYTRLVHDKVLPYQWEALNDRVPGAEKSHAIENFRIAAGLSKGEYYGYVFQDSDVAKWLEAVAYRLTTDPDPALESIADGVIEIIGKAQQADGYLNTYYTVAQPGKRWTDERRRHELYCAGHMMEAAVAYFEATGKQALLEIVCRFADHIETVFGNEPGQKHGYPGHQVIEMALVKLFHVTRERRYLELAKYFIDERGRQPHFFDTEERERGEAGHKGYYEDQVYAYTQSHKPVREQDKAVGHAVRAVYLYSGMADVAMETGDESLAAACRRLWHNVTHRQMYITGGIGAQEYGEDFTCDCDLPNDTMYAETCASIGLVFFAQRMLAMEPKGEYVDVMERALYNGVLSGISLDGERFFYVNPLEVSPQVSVHRHDHRHVALERQSWFGCACCPPNIARLIASIGHYIYSQNQDGIWVHLFVGSELKTSIHGRSIRLLQSTPYPREGLSRIELDLEEACEFTLAIRLPGWCRRPSLSVNDLPVELAPLIREGYAYLQRTWSPGDRIELTLPMPVERIRAHHSVREDAGKISLQRGPVVYCLEEIDNGKELWTRSILSSSTLAVRFDPLLLGGTEVIECSALRHRETPGSDHLYSSDAPCEEPCQLLAVPYRLWGNRGPGEMQLWIREQP